MKAKLLYVLLAVISMTFVVGMGDAVAQAQYSITLIVDWINMDERDIDATAQLLDLNEDPVGLPIDLAPNAGYTEWTGVLNDNDPNEGVCVQFDWDVDPEEAWVNQPRPFEAAIVGTTAEGLTHCQPE